MKIGRNNSPLYIYIIQHLTRKIINVVNHPQITITLLFINFYEVLGLRSLQFLIRYYLAKD